MHRPWEQLDGNANHADVSGSTLQVQNIVCAAFLVQFWNCPRSDEGPTRRPWPIDISVIQIAVGCASN